ncbi:MAG: peptide chain release factor N(5)-glutamine methyltransferase [Candidatus Omnitrophica bacterium]|nr:peptide chain release factor N(5)-glutamine methyltransferase [Candidatus Omnitrophota bacterium]
MSLRPETLLTEGLDCLVARGMSRGEARRQVERLMAKCLGLNKREMIQMPSGVDDSIRRDFLSALHKRSNGIPLQYVEEESEFMDFTFRISPDVLIPRPETENLVERILLELEGWKKRSFKILDIGTGSGVILLSLLKYFPESAGMGSDICEKALSIAGTNAERLGVSGRVTFVQSDVFDAFGGDERFDCIVSNPPYIPERDWQALDEAVKQEPVCALIAGPTGLEFYRRIVPAAEKFLKPGGFLFFETGWNQASEVAWLCRSCGFSDVASFKDDFGIERIIKAEHKRL